MILHGGEGATVHTAEIMFLCDDIEHLRYGGDDNDLNSFFWATPQGCPTKATGSSSFAIIQELIPGGPTTLIVGLLL